MAWEDDMRRWTDDASYASLLDKWCNAPVGSPLFQGELGYYSRKVTKEKRNKLPPGEHAAANKRIGWSG